MTASASVDDVFINCPFDSDYKPFFQAITFTLFVCAFRPRSALELDDASYARLEKILDIVGECLFGIHDLSRTESDPVSGLPRFNMPFEFGIFVGAKRFGGTDQRRKRALVLDVEPYRYQKFISDINGMDIRAHNSEVDLIIVTVRNWLANVSRRRLTSGPRIVAAFHSFQAMLPELAGSAGFEVDEIPPVDFEYMITDWLLTTPLDG